MFEVNARFSNSSPKFSSFKARIVHSTYLLERERERERESHEKVPRFLLMRFETKQEKIELLEKRQDCKERSDKMEVWMFDHITSP